MGIEESLKESGLSAIDTLKQTVLVGIEAGVAGAVLDYVPVLDKLGDIIQRGVSVEVPLYALFAGVGAVATVAAKYWKKAA